MKSRLAFPILAVALLALSAPAMASPIVHIAPTMGSYYLTGSISVPSGSSSGYPATSGSFYIGELSVTLSGKAYDAYCIDLFTSFNLGAQWDATVRSMSDFPLTNNAPFAASKTGQQAAWLANTYAPQVDSKAEGAALQLALWYTIFPSLQASWFNFGSSDSAVKQLASQWAQSAVGMTGNATWLDYTGTNLHAGQDFVVPNLEPVPEPASLLLLGTGLLGVGHFVRRKPRA